MEIEKVELLQPKADEVESAVIRPVFYVKTTDGNKMYVPLDPTNRNYGEVQAWYEAQKKAPFKFDFNDPQATIDAAAKLSTELNKQAAAEKAE